MLCCPHFSPWRRKGGNWPRERDLRSQSMENDRTCHVTEGNVTLDRRKITTLTDNFFSHGILRVSSFRGFDDS